jgi:tRNA(Ile)-lysidine synthase
MARLGPFGAAPEVAVGCSGGGDSLGLAWLAHGWANRRGGRLLALVVDHGLRAESAAESTHTVALLGSRGIAASRLVLHPPPAGPDVSAAARTARHAALAAACAIEGIGFLLLGHTQADQAETVLWRLIRGSGPAGLAGMAARRETPALALLRPLLGIAPGRLRATCRAAGLAWIDDPTNRDPRFARARLRRWLGDPAGEAAAIAAIAGAAGRFGTARAAAEQHLAEQLAAHAVLMPQGFAVVARPEALSDEAAARLVRTVGGLAYAPPARRAGQLLRHGHGTLAGVAVSHAGRLGEGVVLAREPAAVAPPGPAIAGACWDGRWRLPAVLPAGLPASGLSIGALGAAAAPGRDRLPARLAAVLPAFRDAAGRLVAVPGLGHGDRALAATRFAPPAPLAEAAFLPG